MFKASLKVATTKHHIYNGRKTLLASFDDRDGTHNLSPAVTFE